MVRIVFFSLLASAVVLAALPAGAMGQSSVPPGESVPPGDSEVDQYVPTLPDSEGDKTLGGSPGAGSDGGAGGGGAGTAVPPATAESLRAAGPDGEATLGLAEQTAPDDSRRGQGSRGGQAAGRGGFQDGPGGGRSAASADESVAGTILDGLTAGQGGGLGILLPILLGVVAGAGAFMLLRRRLASHGMSHGA